MDIKNNLVGENNEVLQNDEIPIQDQKKNENNKLANNEDLTLQKGLHNDDNYSSIQNNQNCPLKRIEKIKTQIKEQYGKKYRIKQQIDKGGEGQVFDGTILDDSGVEKECVFKIFDCKKEEEFIEERDIMKSFERPINVIKPIDFIKINIKEVKIYILVLEKCKYSLKSELNMFKNKEKIFSFEKLLKIIFDLLDGLIQLRMYKILHLDIKPSNILINKDEDYVIADFGLSSKIESIKNKGSTKGFSPIEQIEYKQLHYKSDVFSLGKTLTRIIKTFKTSNKNLQGCIGRILQRFEEIIQNRMQKEIISERDECQKLHKSFFQLIYSSQFIQFHFMYIHKISQIIELFPFDQNKDIIFFQKQILYYSIKKLQLQQMFYKNKNQKQNFFEVLTETNLFDISASLNTVGLCYQQIGNQKKALKYLLESLELKKTFYLGDHLNIALSLNNIGACYQKFGETYIALKYLLQSLEMKQQIFQENTLDISLSLNNLGSCYKKQGDYQNALKYILESINMTKQMFNESHPYIAVSLSNASECYEIIDDKELANKYRIQCFEMKKQLLQENNSSNNYSLYDHRQYHHDIKLQQKNPKYELQCLEMSKCLFQENNPYIISFSISFGTFYYQLFDSQNYLKYLLLRLEMIKQQYQVYHPDIIFFLNKIGSCHIDMGEPQIALKYFQECNQMIKNQFQKNHAKTILSQSNIEKCQNLIKQEQTNEIYSLGDKKGYIIKKINAQIEQKQGKKYKLKKFISEDEEGYVFDGSILDDYTGENECLFKIYYCKEEDEFIEKKDIMKSFVSPNNIIKPLDFIKIYIKEFKTYILVLGKYKQSLKDELNMFKNKEKIFSFEKLLKIIFDLLDGLIQLRMYRILHLDIKPSNILINKDDDYVITDFGLSSMIRLNKNKGFSGTYSPIEQIQQKQLDFKSDVFSLGKTLNEIIETFKTSNQNLQGSIPTILQRFEDIIKNRMQNEIVSERDECQKLHKSFFQLINSSEFIQFHYKYIHRINFIIELFPFEVLDITFFQKQILYYTIKKLQLQQMFYKNKNQKQNFFEVLTETNLFDISASLNTVGLCYQQIGNQKKALKYLLESLELKKTFYLGDHLNIALSLNNIGACYQKFGETYIALKYLLQSLEMKQQIFQENNLDVALTLNNIGSCYKKHGDYKNSLKYQLESINITKQMFNESHPYIAVSLSNVSECYKKLENKELANKYRIQSDEMKYQLLQGNNSSLANSLYNHRQYQNDIKQKQNNPKYELQCLEMSKYLFQENNPDITLFPNSFGTFYYQLFYSQNFLKYLLLRLEMIKQQYQDYHPDIVFFLNKIGTCHIDMGEPQIALKYFQKCHKNIKYQFQENYHKIIESQSNIDECNFLIKQVLTHQTIPLFFFYLLKFKIDSLKKRSNHFQGLNKLFYFNILFFLKFLNI